ncbi:MAG: SRPBCC family protein [Opitutus sp.]
MALETQSAEQSAAPSRNQSSRAKIAVPGNRGVKVVRSCTVRKPAAELYQFWRSLENLTSVIKHPVSITRLSDTESHWKATAPGKTFVEWDAVIINDHPNELIAWRSKEGAEIPNAGTVRFEAAPGDEGTEVTVQLEYDAPGGRFAALIAKLTGEEPEQQVAEALRRFKALMEAGEIPSVEGQSAGGPQRELRRKERQQMQRKAAS